MAFIGFGSTLPLPFIVGHLELSVKCFLCHLVARYPPLTSLSSEEFQGQWLLWLGSDLEEEGTQEMLGGLLELLY